MRPPSHVILLITTLAMAPIMAAASADGGRAPDQSPRSDECRWREGFELRALDGNVHAMVVFDDGSGPVLIVGGAFERADGTWVGGIASWDGTAWSALAGPSGVGVEGTVEALAVFDDGTGPAVYAGGDFLVAGGVAANNIARWDGTTWSALVDGIHNGLYRGVRALMPYDDGHGAVLAVGGYFWRAGGSYNAWRVALWDGAGWQALPGPSDTGVSGPVFALATVDLGAGPLLVIGGEFSAAGGVPANSVATWDGTELAPLSGPSGIGVGGSVYAFAALDDGPQTVLVVGGSFDDAGGSAAESIALWDGSSWSPLSGPSGPTGIGGAVDALAIHDDGSGPALYAAGHFHYAGESRVENVARWNGDAWAPLVGEFGRGADRSVLALASHDTGDGPVLVVGGKFETAGRVAASKIAAWDGAAWSSVSAARGAGASSVVGAFAQVDLGSGPVLYAGGDFLTAGGVLADYVAAWNGHTWSALGAPGVEGTGAAVYALFGFDDGRGPALLAGGDFHWAGGELVNYVARWDGTGWGAFSGPDEAGMDGPVYAFEVFDDGTGPALYAAGDFLTAGGPNTVVRSVAKWDGSAWSALGTGLWAGPYGNPAPVLALQSWDDGSGPALYVAGAFRYASDVPCGTVARWDGSEWSCVGSTSDGLAHTMLVHDDGSGAALWVGGSFASMSGVAATGIARWDGATWSAAGDPFGHGSVWDLTVHDDGSGAALYAGGEFTVADGAVANGLARWDGVAWSPVGPVAGVAGAVWALGTNQTATGSSLMVGGEFPEVAGVASWNIGEWWCPPDGWIFGDDFAHGDTAAWSATVVDLAGAFDQLLIARGISGDYVACSYDALTGDYTYLGIVFNEADGGLGGTLIVALEDLYWTNESLASTVAPYAGEDPDGDGVPSVADGDAFDSQVQ